MTGTRPEAGRGHQREIALGVLGERTPDAVRLAHLRMAFLRVAAATVNGMIDDLVTRAYPDVRHAVPGARVSLSALTPAWARAVARGWAVRWRLRTANGRAVPWVVDCACVALDRIRRRRWTAAQLFAPPVLVWDTTDPSIPRLRGSGATRKVRPLRWLALRVCANRTPGEICADASLRTVEVENARQAQALGLYLPARRRGRPPGRRNGLTILLD